MERLFHHWRSRQEQLIFPPCFILFLKSLKVLLCFSDTNGNLLYNSSA